MEEVVRELNIGVVIDQLTDLHDIDGTMLNVNFGNLKRLKAQVETGHFTSVALGKALE